MTIERRVLDQDAVERAESVRRVGKVFLAAEIAATGLGLKEAPLTDEEVAEFARSPLDRAVLACLARIHVDSLKTLANQAQLPPKVLSPLEEACKIINTVYRNADFDSGIRAVDSDHRGRRHNFWPEMKRDVAKTLFAASVLYEPSKSDELSLLGERILQETYQALSDGHPTKPLIGIEVQLSRALRGQKPNMEALRRDFETLRESDEETNPHRVATVASWFIVWGERLKDEELAATGSLVFTRIVDQHPEWAFMTEDERQKMARRQIRRLLFRLTTPLLTGSRGRDSLYSGLKRS